MRKHADKLLCLLICAVVVGLDQLAKSAVRAMMDARGGDDLVIIPGFLSIINSFNQGIAFGMFQGIRIYVLLIPIAAAVLILFFFLKEGMPGRWASVVGLGMMLGGAFGNMVDRLRFGHVYDFVKAYIGERQWPTFNVADCFIVIGFAVFAIVMFFSGEKDE
ncbi:MAG: signal peptidase II [bacterium]